MSDFLPITEKEMIKRGWDYVDVVLVTPDAYVDMPSFAMAIIGRVIENAGFRVAILSQPDWHNTNDFKRFGRPRLCFAISSGNMDSMINKYTHNKKPRSEDDYSEDGKRYNRPDRTTIVFSNIARMAYPDIPIIAGGLESTMRRFAHYDYWSNTVKRPILLDSRADMLVYGMGEKQIIEILKRLDKGENIKDIKDIRGTVFKMGEKEIEKYKSQDDILIIPSYEEVKSDKLKFAIMTEMIFKNINPYSAKAMLQSSDTRAVIQNPPSFPLSQQELDDIYDLPFNYLPHPIYKKRIPAYETVKNSITIHRGCYGGCSFCSLSHHQGKFIQSRSIGSVMREIKKLSDNKKNIIISDIGGPSANMYFTGGKNFEICKRCERISCLHPSICSNLNISSEKLIELMKEVSNYKNIKKVFVASGIRMDIATAEEKYIKEIAINHTSGYLKVAPEHTQKKVLDIMKKPPIETFIEFERIFDNYSKSAGKEQYLITYFISAFPRTTLDDAIDMAVFMKKHNLRPLQINDFLPAPSEYATAIYYTGMDPFTKEKIYVPVLESERKMHRALMQYFKKENIPLIIKALKIAKRTELIKFFLSRR